MVSFTTMAEMEVLKEETVVEERRTSERTRGKRISYNEKELAKLDDVSPKKRVRCQRKNGTCKNSNVRAVVDTKKSNEMEAVMNLLERSNDTDGLAGLGLKLEKVQEDAYVDGVEKSDHFKVKETLRIFNNYYLHLIQVCVIFLHM